MWHHLCAGVYKILSSPSSPMGKGLLMLGMGSGPRIVFDNHTVSLLSKFAKSVKLPQTGRQSNQWSGPGR